MKNILSEIEYTISKLYHIVKKKLLALSSKFLLEFICNPIPSDSWLVEHFQDLLPGERGFLPPQINVATTDMTITSSLL